MKKSFVAFSRRGNSCRTAAAIDLGYAEAIGELREGHRMPVVRVHAARAEQADEMKPAAARPGTLHGCNQCGIGEERTVHDGGVDARQVLCDGPAGASNHDLLAGGGPVEKS